MRVRQLIFLVWMVIAGNSASIATEDEIKKLQPTFFELPDYTTEITNEQSNLFLNPEDSLSLFDPSKISIIGIGSADDVNYAFVSNSKKVSYVRSGEEMLPGVFIQNISPANNTVKLTYKGKVYSLSIDNPSIDR